MSQFVVVIKSDDDEKVTLLEARDVIDAMVGFTPDQRDNIVFIGLADHKAVKSYLSKKEIGEKLEDLTDSVGDMVDNVLEESSEKFKKGKEALSDAGEKVGSAISEGADKVGSKLKGFASKFKKKS